MFESLAIGMKRSSIKVLLASGNNCRDACMEGFRDCLYENKVLEVLDLSFNDITDIGGIELARALQVNHSIKKIRLADNDLGNGTGK